MCNLYKLRRSAEEIAHLFGAGAQPGANFAEEIYPGYPGLVVAAGRVRPMTWGFPLEMTGKRGQPIKPKAVTNAREDKLHTAFWRASFETRRCLVPVTAWAEAEGVAGRMTRTWYAVPGGETFAVAGLWRPTAQWGDAYAMIMVDSCVHMADVHDRMPVILPASAWEQWQSGSAAEAFALCQTWPDLLEVERTEVRWSARPQAPAPCGDTI